MPVYIQHGNMWLMLKEVYTLRTSSKKSKQSRSAPYGMVAVSVSRLDLRGYNHVEEVQVPSSKVSRFAAKMHLAALSALVVIEPRGEDYVAKLYGRTKKEVEEAKKVALEVLRELQKRRERAEAEEYSEVEIGEAAEE